MNTRFIIVMGVSGCGKSSVASALATNLSAKFIEADDFHSAEAREQMAAGNPLTDEQRLPWIQRLCESIESHLNRNNRVIMACSALRKAHRDMFRRLPISAEFVWLDGAEQLIAQRIAQRSGHFFAAKLLATQFAALESPEGEADVIWQSIDMDYQQLVDELLVKLEQT